MATAATPAEHPATASDAGLPWQPLVLAGAALAMLALFFAMMLRSTDGHLSPPLDDTLIYFQYAKQIAHGQVFIYIDGDPRTSGSTSFTYPFALAAGYLAGFRDDRLVLFGLMLAAGMLIVAALLTRAVARHLMDDIPAWTAALLVAMNGWLAWTAFSMMESGLHAVALLLALLLFLRSLTSTRDLFVFAAVLALLPFVRPELSVLGAGIAAYWTVASFFGPKIPFVQRATPFVAACAGALAYFGLMLALTGSGRPDTYVVKSIFAYDFLLWSDRFSMIRENFGDHLRFSFEFFSPPYLWVFAAALATVGAVAFIAEDVRARRPTIRALIPLLFVAGLLTASLQLDTSIHFHRWAAPYEPLAALLVVRGVVTVLALLPSAPAFGWPVTAVLTVVAAVPSVQAADEYGKNTSDIYLQQTQAAFWLRDNTPADTVVGLNDAGAMPYYSRRRAYDIIGLVTKDAAEAFAAGPGSSFEQIEALPEEDRPDIYAIYWFGIGFASPEIGFLTEVHRITLDEVTIAGSPDKIIYEPDNSLLGAGDDPGEVPAFAEGWRVVDRLDVTHLASESAHGYDYRPPQTGVPPPQVLANRTYSGNPQPIIDGGRVNVSESFTLDAEAGKPYVVLARTAGDTPVALVVEGVGAIVPVQVSAAPDAWHDVMIARDDTSDESIEITITSERQQPYATYTYWLLQPTETGAE